MKKVFLLILLIPFMTEAQIKIKNVISSANINLQSQNQLGEKDANFQISIGSRTGKFIKDSTWAIGLNWSLTYRHTKVFKVSSIQSGGNWYEKGGGDGIYGSVGFFYDKYFRIKPNLFISLNNDLSYFWGQFIENTSVVDENGNNVGVLVESYQYNPARLQYNFWPNLMYFFTKRHAITASIGSFNIGLIGKHPKSNRFLEDPKTINVNLNFPSIGLGYSMIF